MDGKGSGDRGWR